MASLPLILLGTLATAAPSVVVIGGAILLVALLARRRDPHREPRA
ncbi:hypothetical protein [Agrococcus sp. HG114]|nr:hypothetical protein [Agrococcus sp. HG114]MCR8671809.1 hypothetical protein [Agrococcus sp. HG114]